MTMFDAAVQAVPASLSAPDEASRSVQPGSASAGAVVIVALTGAWRVISIFRGRVLEIGLRLGPAESPALNAICAHS
jgi:hypothetical protein